MFSRSKLSPYHDDVAAIRGTGEAWRVQVDPATDAEVRRVSNAVRKAGRELSVPLNVKYVEGYVYFRAKESSAA